MLEKFKDIVDTDSLLNLALESFPAKSGAARIGLACSFSNEDIIIIDMLSRLKTKVGEEFKVFSLDTGRLNSETYEVAEEISKKYQIKIEWYFPKREQVEELINSKGLFSFKESLENRKECCKIRKVEPLKRALSTVDAWITGQRKEQSVTRAKLLLAEEDKGNNIIKFNPLANWSASQVKDYMSKNNLPYNKLYDAGYQSIGCAPCTRATEKGQDERAGRWWWENPEHKECGLHLG